MTKVHLNDILKTDFRETLQTRGRKKPQIWNPGSDLTRKISGPEIILSLRLIFSLRMTNNNHKPISTFFTSWSR